MRVTAGWLCRVRCSTQICASNSKQGTEYLLRFMLERREEWPDLAKRAWRGKAESYTAIVAQKKGREI